MTTITFQCYSCNQVLKVGADKAGRKAKCIKCGTILTIPVASDEEAVTPPPSSRNTSIPREAPPRKPEPAPVEAEFVDDEEEPPRRRRRDEDEVDEDRPRRRRSADDEDDEDDRPRKRRRDEDDEDEDDRPRGRRPRDEDEEEDDRPRKRRRDEDEEDDDDRPRRRARAEDEDDDDRPRRRRSRDDYDDDEEDDDRGRRRKVKKTNPWPRVKIGLLLNFISACILIGFAGLLILTALFALISFLATSQGMAQTASIMFLIAMILYVGLECPAIAGYVMALFTPNKKGALAMSITALSLGSISLILKIIFFLVPYFSEAKRGYGAVHFLMPYVADAGGLAVTIILAILILAVLGAELIIYPLYLRAVTAQLKDRYLEGGAFRSLGFACGAVGSQILVTLIAVIWSHNISGPSGAKAFVWVSTILKIIAGGATAAFAVMYMRYLQELRSRVD